jgi:predicted RNA-binding protein
MCLAKAFVDPGPDTEGRLLMENVVQADVDGDRVRLTSLLGDTEELEARIRSINFTDSRLELESVAARN